MGGDGGGVVSTQDGYGTPFAFSTKPWLGQWWIPATAWCINTAVERRTPVRLFSASVPMPHRSAALQCDDADCRIVWALNRWHMAGVVTRNDYMIG